MCIVVKDKNDIAAFADYKPSDDTGPVAAIATPAAAPPKVETPAPSPPPQPVTQRQATPPPPPPAPASSAAPVQPAGGRVFATPLARKLATERNIDISVLILTFFKFLSCFLLFFSRLKVGTRNWSRQTN